jgi:hypothetical protein
MLAKRLVHTSSGSSKHSWKGTETGQGLFTALFEFLSSVLLFCCFVVLLFLMICESLQSISLSFVCNRQPVIVLTNNETSGKSSRKTF